MPFGRVRQSKHIQEVNSMKVTGVITEYNPFHNGHKYHIEEARRITDADYIVAVMSPDYVQRGVPAMIDKHARAKMALAAGVDLVLELPVGYATGSAEYFAAGAVNILDALGIIRYCCFGSEHGTLDYFLEIAKILLEEPPSYQDALKMYLKKGDSFPVARKKALCAEPNSKWEDFLASPNNILGLEYCKKLLQLQSTIEPITIQRIENDYHDEELSARVSSATAIRRKLEDTTDILAIKQHMPKSAFRVLAETLDRTGILNEDDFSLLLKYKLMCETPESLTNYMDVSESLANRISNHLNEFRSFSQFADLLKTRELTRTRINRALLHILLNIHQPDPITHIRVLGFQESAAPLLSAIKAGSKLPLITKVNEKIYDPFAANLYESTASMKYDRGFVHEFSKTLIKY